MKILSIEPSVSFIVETDKSEWPTFRRHGENIWENLMGESWEPVYHNEEGLERLFQEWLQQER